MGYRYYSNRYRSRYRSSYSRYYGSSSSRYSRPLSFGWSITNDLWSYFLHLDYNKFQELLMFYREEYGESAYDYAVRTYSKWRSGETSPAAQTKERLIGILPPLLTAEQRISLFKKMMEKEWTPSDYMQDGTTIGAKNITSTWYSYSSDISQIIKDLHFAKTKYEVKFPELAESKKAQIEWLFSDEIKIAQEIVLAQKKAMAYEQFDDAIETAKGFLDKCNSLYCAGEIYSSVSMSIKAPMASFYLAIKPEKKSFFQKLKGLF